MNSIQQGNLAESKVVSHFIQLGYEIYVPFGSGNSCDMVITKDGMARRVSVKSSSHKIPKYNSWTIELRQRNLHRTNHFDSSKSDILAVYLPVEDRIIILESNQITNKSKMRIQCL